MTKPLVFQPAEQTTIRVGPNEITYKLEGGPFSMIEYRVAPLFVAPPVLHWHADTDFAGYCLDGRLQFRFEDRVVELVPGTTIFVPRDCKFAWSNPEDAPARLLFIYYPAGFEQYFREVDGITRANPGKSIPDLMPQIAPLWEKYKIERE